MRLGPLYVWSKFDPNRLKQCNLSDQKTIFPIPPFPQLKGAIRLVRIEQKTRNGVE